MLNPDMMPEAKKQALQKRLVTKKKSTKQDAFVKSNDKVISDSIIRQTAPPPGKPAYKAPATPILTTKKSGPVFNSKAKIDNSQVVDRTPSNSDVQEKFVHREKFAIASRLGRDNSEIPYHKPPAKKMGPMGLKLKGTNNKEALLARLRKSGK